ncbi:MAG TPA: 4-(cytidine 5'-diphospho)-2-C-methyl-D-erythritol kinase [Firmicutes bacterium]|jgi:4-diphosphocytidyl-2-C-methyl-D-erythritol kinase|nr:4-(cytidine 5'-diphospho)-2-C-methyl-D-erythritol kinase [Bacillota bacterium]HAN87293.1 4-(cytidine 5'-diphospho)-2-C-methyl-D-erythritol kinase [Bacillota bacterium]
MHVVESRAWAKVNLAFDIVGRRSDGYHDIESVMHRIELADKIRIERLDIDPGSAESIRVHVFPKVVPDGKDNIAYRAAWAFFESTGERGAVSISIEKKIPVAAGLGGGSADAAAVLAGMNQLWDRPLVQEELFGVARSIGADVPFCLLCHGDSPRAWAALACGIGDRLAPLPPLPGIPLVVAKPEASLSAGEIYGMWDARTGEASGEGSYGVFRSKKTATKAQALADWMQSQNRCSLDMAQVAPFMVNELELLAAQICPELLGVKAALLELGATAALMSGSGPTVFGLFQSDNSAYAAARTLREQAAFVSQWGRLDVFVTRAGPRSAVGPDVDAGQV